MLHLKLKNRNDAKYHGYEVYDTTKLTTTKLWHELNDQKQNELLLSDSWNTD